MHIESHAQTSSIDSLIYLIYIKVCQCNLSAQNKIMRDYPGQGELLLGTPAMSWESHSVHINFHLWMPVVFNNLS